MINILGFLGQVVSLEQLDPAIVGMKSTHGQDVNTWAWLCSNKFFLTEAGGPHLTWRQ